MNKRVIAGVGAAMLCSLVLVVAAQEPPPQRPTTPAMADKTVTVTGCLAAGTEPNQFVLTTISDKPAKPGETPTGTAGSTEPQMKYALQSTDEDLKKHAGHKVTVTGVVTKEDMGRPGMPGTPADPKAVKMSRLMVKSIKHVAATCP